VFGSYVFKLFNSLFLVTACFVSVNSFAEGTEKLSESSYRFAKENKFCDAHFEIPGVEERLCVHKVVLSTYVYYEKLFTGDFREKSTGIVEFDRGTYEFSLDGLKKLRKLLYFKDDTTKIVNKIEDRKLLLALANYFNAITSSKSTFVSIIDGRLAEITVNLEKLWEFNARSLVLLPKTAKKYANLYKTALKDTEIDQNTKNLKGFLAENKAEKETNFYMFLTHMFRSSGGQLLLHSIILDEEFDYLEKPFRYPLVVKSTTYSAGYLHTCAIREDGDARCWGRNISGQATVPGDLGKVTVISAGRAHTCAIREDGDARCWGSNREGQATVPRDLGKVTAISAGGDHTCAIREDGDARCWGRNRHGQATVPGDLGKVTAISAGGDHTCAIREDGDARCWGKNIVGETTVPGDLGKVTAISAGGDLTCAIREDGDARCWGKDLFGQTTVPGDLSKVTAISAGRAHNCAIREDGDARCWGFNGSGQSTVPGDLGKVTAISVGAYHTCAIREDGDARCWGENNNGQATVPEDLGRVKIP